MKDKKLSLVERAKNVKIKRNQQNTFSDEQWELAKAFIKSEVTTRQVVVGLGRANNPGVVYPWVLAMLRDAFEKGKVKFL